MIPAPFESSLALTPFTKHFDQGNGLHTHTHTQVKWNQRDNNDDDNNNNNNNKKSRCCYWRVESSAEMALKWF